MPPQAPSRQIHQRLVLMTARPEYVTETGWRVVGNAIPLVTRAAEAAELPRGRDADVLYAARFRVRPRLSKDDAIHAVLASLWTSVMRTWPEAPPLTRDHPVSRPVGRFQGLRWDVTNDSGTWKGELLVRHPHPIVAGAPCTTHVVVVDQPGHCTLTVRVTADDGVASVRGSVGAGQARPTFLSDLHRVARLVYEGRDSDPEVLREHDIDAFVRNVLLGESREAPAAVLAPLEDGTYLVAPQELADELLGVAHLYVIDRHPTTFALTDTLGDKRLSAFWGALRIYFPRFSCADRPEDHPLLLRERVTDPVIRADLIGKLSRRVAPRVRMPDGVDASSESTPNARATATAARPALTLDAAAQEPAASCPPLSSAVPSAASDARRNALLDAPATPVAASAPNFMPLLAGMTSILGDLGAQIGALASTITQLVEANAALSDEIARLRTTNTVRTASTTSLERRIGVMESLIRAHFAAPLAPGAVVVSAPIPPVVEQLSSNEGDTLTLIDVMRQAATEHADALLILDAAEKSAADSPFEDADRVAVVLEAMADVARRRQNGGLGIPLRNAFRELGIEYRGAIAPSTSDRQRQQYLFRGESTTQYECYEHIVLGVSYDPRYCLRIYFTSRAPVEPRFVIGYVGRHMESVSTT